MVCVVVTPLAFIFLLDNIAPSRGITITYPNGGKQYGYDCGKFDTEAAVKHHNERHPDDTVKVGDTRYREFVVDVICDDDVLNIPDDGEQIVEEMTCSYRTSLKSIYGCPTGW